MRYSIAIDLFPMSSVSGATRPPLARHWKKRSRSLRTILSRYVVALVLSPAGMSFAFLPPLGAVPGADEKSPREDGKDARRGEPIHSISGRVLSASGAPILGAKVQAFVDASPEEKAAELTRMVSIAEVIEVDDKANPQTTTDADGTFELGGLGSKLYRIRVIASGYATQDFGEIPAPREQLKLVLDPALTLRGSVQAVSGGAIEGARVKVYFGIEFRASNSTMGDILSLAISEIVTVRTTADGVFQVDSLGRGNYSFVVDAPGYQPAEETRKMVPGSQEQPLAFSLRPGQKLSGIVRGPGQRAVADCQVRVHRTGGGGRTPSIGSRAQAGTARGLTDKEGRFCLDTLPEGQYEIACSHPEYQTLRRPGLRAPGEDVILELRPKVSVGGRVETDSGAGGTVSGRVIDAGSKRPLKGARVQIVQGSRRFVRPASGAKPTDSNPIRSTGEDGGFAYSGLKPGSLSLRVTRDGYVGKLISAIDPAIAVTAQNLEIQLDTGCEITGIVVNSAGMALADFPVYLISGDAEQNQMGKTGADGKFRFAATPPGSYSVKAHKFATTTTPAEEGGATVEAAVGKPAEVKLSVKAVPGKGTGKGAPPVETK